LKAEGGAAMDKEPRKRPQAKIADAGPDRSMATPTHAIIKAAAPSYAETCRAAAYATKDEDICFSKISRSSGIRYAVWLNEGTNLDDATCGGRFCAE